MTGRYQMVLTPCEATAKWAWGKTVAAANSLAELFDQTGWGPGQLDYNQTWELRDTKLNKVISEDDYTAIIRKLKGWE